MAVRAEEVILVDCQRGDGAMRRNVLQVFSKPAAHNPDEATVETWTQLAGYRVISRPAACNPDAAMIARDAKAERKPVPLVPFAAISSIKPPLPALTLSPDLQPANRANPLHGSAFLAGDGIGRKG